MIVTDVATVDATMPEGFAHESLQCTACGDIERRFVFGSASSKRDESESASPARAAISTSAPAEAAAPPSSYPFSLLSSLSAVSSPGQAPAQAGSSAPAWTHAVEKFRNRQAHIGVRPDRPQSDWSARMCKALEKLAPHGHRRRATGGAAPHRIGAAHRGAGEASAQQTTIEPSADAIQQFNQFRDDLLTDRLAAAAEPCPDRSAPLRSQKEAE
jgi:hypothetical protein